MRLSVGRVSKPNPNTEGKPPGKHRILRLVLQIAVLAAVIAGIFLVINNHSKNKRANQSQAMLPGTTNELESITANADQSYLNSGEYGSYQLDQNGLAGHYLDAKDLSDAARIENNVFAKVPKDKILTQTYVSMVNVQKAKNNKAGIKKYEQLLIAQLQKQGNPTTAAAWQRDLKNLK